jgi:hypothetical protein
MLAQIFNVNVVGINKPAALAFHGGGLQAVVQIHANHLDTRR